MSKSRFIAARINEIDMRLGQLGYASVDACWKTNALATPFNRLYLIRAGRGMLSAGNHQVILEPGRAYLLPAGLPCSYSCEGTLSLLFFHFDLLRADQSDLLEKVTCLPVADFSRERIDWLRNTCEGSGYSHALQIVHAIQGILLDMSESYPLHWDDLPAYSACVAQTISKIHRELSAQLRIESLAKSQFISRSYLSRQFRQEVGMPIKQYIHMQLVNTAQWQLSNTDASIEKISSNLGFCNQFYFSEFFKKRCRVSPLQYRHGTKY